MRMDFDLSKIDFRTTPVENMFLDTYLEQAPGNAIKFYLYGWKACYGKGDSSLSLESLTETLHLSQEELLEAISYWIEEGLVILREEEGDFNLDFRSIILYWAGIYEPVESLPMDVLRENDGASINFQQDMENAEERIPSLFDQLAPSRESDQSTQEKGHVSSDTPSIETDKGGDENRRKLFDDLEDYLSEGVSYQVLLKPDEIRTIHDFLDTYPITPDFFLYAYKKAATHGEASSRSFKYVITIIENWLRFEHISNQEDLDAFLVKAEEAKKNKKQSSRKRAKAKAKNLSDDKRLSKEERTAWVKQRLEQSKRRSLKGGSDDE